jgi:LacI family transcriptional regulator
MKKKATLDDIAKVVNLTKVSVSKALRDHPDISELTKVKVKEVAKTLGYRPNLIARSLTSAKSKTIGVVVPKIAHNFFAHIVAGIQQYAAEKDYGIVLTVSDENERLEKRHIENLVSMQVEGLLVSVSMETKDNSVFKWVRDLQIPLVFFDRHIPNLGLNSVIIDDVAASEDAVSRLIQKGYTNIAHVGGYESIFIGRNRRTGYENAIARHNLSLGSDFVVEGGFGEDAGYNGFKMLISRGIIPDAIFAVTFPVALGIYKAMKEIKPELFDQIKILTVGADDLFTVFSYPQFYVDQPAIKIGTRAAELLIQEIHGKIEPNNRIEYVATNFVENS